MRDRFCQGPVRAGGRIRPESHGVPRGAATGRRSVVGDHAVGGGANHVEEGGDGRGLRVFRRGSRLACRDCLLPLPPLLEEVLFGVLLLCRPSLFLRPKHYGETPRESWDSEGADLLLELEAMHPVMFAPAVGAQVLLLQVTVFGRRRDPRPHRGGDICADGAPVGGVSVLGVEERLRTPAAFRHPVRARLRSSRLGLGLGFGRRARRPFAGPLPLLPLQPDHNRDLLRLLRCQIAKAAGGSDRVQRGANLHGG